jgi:hypothetical protein
VAAVLAGNHSLEAVKVVHVGAGSASSGGLGGGRGGPLGGQIELLASLLDLGGARSTLDGDDELGESNALEVQDLALDTVEGSIDDDTVAIDDLDDDGDGALLLTLVELNDATNLNKTSEERGRLFKFSKIKTNMSATNPQGQKQSDQISRSSCGLQDAPFCLFNQ